MADYRKKTAIDNLDTLIKETGNLRKITERVLEIAEPYSQKSVEDSRYLLLHYIEKTQQMLINIREEM